MTEGQPKYHKGFERAKNRTMRRMNEFSEEVTKQDETYSVGVTGIIQPAEHDIYPAGVVEVSIERLDKQPINPIQVIGLTGEIDRVTIPNHRGMKGIWMYKKDEKGQEDKTVYLQWVGFPVKLSLRHERYLKAKMTRPQQANPFPRQLMPNQAR